MCAAVASPNHRLGKQGFFTPSPRGPLCPRGPLGPSLCLRSVSSRTAPATPAIPSLAALTTPMSPPLGHRVDLHAARPITEGGHPKSWAAAPGALEGSPVPLGIGFPCCLRLASPRMSMTSVANSWALKRANFCLPCKHEGGFQLFRGLQGRPRHTGRLLLPTQSGALFQRFEASPKLASPGSRLALPLPPAPGWA